MKIGTKSVLFGAHCFFIHPFFVALAWWKLYGFPFDPRLWVAFFIHDIGYIGKPNMDGPEGERHVEFGAKVMHWLFDRGLCPSMVEFRTNQSGTHLAKVECVYQWQRSRRWHNFSMYHSRFYSKRDGVQPSRLCAADKLAVGLEPWWLYLPRVIASGEINEYMKLASKRAKAGEPVRYSYDTSTKRRWFREMSTYCAKWAYTHADGRVDTWTPDLSKNAAESQSGGERVALNDAGVWQ